MSSGTGIVISELQSTHPRGCDGAFGFSVAYYVCFNPHTREGVTTSDASSHPCVKGFNPHTREGVTMPSPVRAGLVKCFNPHTREGVTISRAVMVTPAELQSTHPRGCDTFP